MLCHDHIWYKVFHNYYIHYMTLVFFTCCINQLKCLSYKQYRITLKYKCLSHFLTKPLGFLRRNFKTAPPNIRVGLLSLSLVCSQVEYTTSAWSPYAQWLVHDITRLDGLQHRGARFVLKNFQQTANIS